MSATTTTDEFLNRVELTIMDDFDGATAEQLSDGTVRVHPDDEDAWAAAVNTMDAIASEMSTENRTLAFVTTQLSGEGEDEALIYEVSNVRFQTDTEAADAAIASAEIAERLRRDLDDPNVRVEVDAPGQKVWVHDVTDDLIGETRRIVREYATHVSADAGSPLTYDFEVKTYAGRNAQAAHIEHIDFDHEY